MEDPANVRTHGEDNIESIKASLRRFGQQKPLVVDCNNVVRVGNGTLVAARSLGWATVDVVRTKLEGVEATAYAIADNRTAELAAWDRAALLAALKSLQYEPVFGSGAVGFTDEDLNEMLRASVDAGTATSYKDVDGKEYDESVVNEVKYLVCPQCGLKFPK